MRLPSLHFGNRVGTSWDLFALSVLAGSSGSQQLHWCEVARPQVHGHDFSCIAFVPFKSTTLGPSANGSTGGSSSCGGHVMPSLVYVSGSEEKVLRVFEATQVCFSGAFSAKICVLLCIVQFSCMGSLGNAAARVRDRRMRRQKTLA